MKRSYIGQAWLVLVLSLSFGAALAGVETWLRPTIEANKLAETIRRIPQVVPGADAARSARAEPLVVTTGTGRAVDRHDVFRALDPAGRQVGWVIKAVGKGFADRIELLIGLDAPARTITGLSVLDQKETPGLGNKIELMGDKRNKGFLWQFRHHHPRADRPLVVTTASPDRTRPGAGNRIMALSGATISSQSVCTIINEALSAELCGKLVSALGRVASSDAGSTHDE